MTVKYRSLIACAKILLSFAQLAYCSIATPKVYLVTAVTIDFEECERMKQHRS